MEAFLVLAFDPRLGPPFFRLVAEEGVAAAVFFLVVAVSCCLRREELRLPILCGSSSSTRWVSEISDLTWIGVDAVVIVDGPPISESNGFGAEEKMEGGGPNKPASPDEDEAKAVDDDDDDEEAEVDSDRGTDCVVIETDEREDSGLTPRLMSGLALRDKGLALTLRDRG